MIEKQRALARKLAADMSMCFEPVHDWVKRRGITDTEQMPAIYGGLSYHDCLPQVATEIWRRHLESTEA